MGINNDCSVIRDGRVPLSPRPNILLLLVSQGFKTIWTATPNGHFCYCHTLSLAFEHVQMWDRKHLDLEKVLVVCVCVCLGVCGIINIFQYSGNQTSGQAMTQHAPKPQLPVVTWHGFFEPHINIEHDIPSMSNVFERFFCLIYYIYNTLDEHNIHSDAYWCLLCWNTTQQAVLCYCRLLLLIPCPAI